MRTLYTVEQIRAIDAWAIARASAGTLMRKAGAGAHRAICARWPDAATVAVVAGPGNNGGDGWVVARLFAAAGVDVTVYEWPSVSGEAAAMRDDYLAVGGRVAACAAFGERAADVVVDALFGNGLSRALDGEALRLVEAMNASPSPVVSLDSPSGLNADTGAVMPDAVRADLTATFIGLKRGLYTGAARDYCGEIVLETLGVDANDAPVCATTRLADKDDIAVPARPASAHKGRCGRVLVVGGNTGFGGAVRLAGEAAARSGAGLVGVALRPGNLPMVEPCPELMAREVNDAATLDEDLRQCDVVALGPGLGRDDWARAMFAKALACDKPVVVDADALQLLGDAPEKSGRWILTPHPGEAAALLSTTPAQIEADRFDAAARIAEKYGGVCVLKGAGTVVYEAGYNKNVATVCDVGCPAMASGGMGDVLTGIIAGLWAQALKGGWDMPEGDIARLGVCVHGEAAARAARGRTRGLLASDLFAHLNL